MKRPVRYVGRHRGSAASRPAAPLAGRVPVTPGAIVAEGLYTVVRHLADGRTPEDAWALGTIDAADMRAAKAVAQ